MVATSNLGLAELDEAVLRVETSRLAVLTQVIVGARDALEAWATDATLAAITDHTWMERLLLLTSSIIGRSTGRWSVTVLTATPLLLCFIKKEQMK